MERGGKVADVLQRIGMSPLAVIRTGMIQANMALLSSSRLPAHESEHLLEMLLGELVISSCLLYTSPSPRDKRQSRMPSSA